MADEWNPFALMQRDQMLAQHQHGGGFGNLLGNALGVGFAAQSGMLAQQQSHAAWLNQMLAQQQHVPVTFCGVENVRDLPQTSSPPKPEPSPDDFELWCADSRPLTFEEWCEERFG